MWMKRYYLNSKEFNVIPNSLFGRHRQTNMEILMVLWINAVYLMAVEVLQNLIKIMSYLKKSLLVILATKCTMTKRVMTQQIMMTVPAMIENRIE